MCLLIKKNQKRNPKIAKEDIVCYKHLIPSNDSDIYLTSYEKCQVEIGNTYTSKFSFCEALDPKEVKVIIGLHSFLNINDARNAARSYCEVLVECIIPKGSKYYKGKFIGTYGFTSDILKYIKVIENFCTEACICDNLRHIC